MNRREFIAALGGAVAVWPLLARAQQQIPVVGYLATNAPSPTSNIAYAAFKSGLAEMGFVDSQNVRVEFLYAEGHYDRLPKLASEFVGRHVAVIFASGSVNAALAAKAATTSIPIVFANGSDPVASGLVASIARPGGNVTGATSQTNFMGAKRLGILHELLPQAGVFSMLVNRASAIAEAELQETQAAAASLGLKLNVLSASTLAEIETAFDALASLKTQALVVGSDPFFADQSNHITELAARHAMPAIYQWRLFAEQGGLMSYGTPAAESFRQAGVYAGQILKGNKPADLPVMQPVKFEFVINLKTAKSLGIDIPPTLLARADEVIE